ncbi:M15 family metallopeptidase domain-containing protein [Telluribacter humicola]
MNTRDITLAHPLLQEAWHYLLEQWAVLHPNDPVPFLTQVFRPRAMQEAYYAQGRQPLLVVNDLRRKAGLGPIGPTENKRRITNSLPGSSRHERTPSEAFDIAFVKAGTKKELDWNPALFEQAARIIRKKFPQITWGADWNKNWRTSDERFIDAPHFQI